VQSENNLRESLASVNAAWTMIKYNNVIVREYGLRVVTAYVN